MKRTERPQLRFPRLLSLKFESFSLFSQQSNVALIVNRGVTCLAGANGVGKSTFLATVDYALTGRVPLPTREYSSSDEYYQDSASFPKLYFEGRIRQDDRKTASVSADLEIDDRTFHITRGLFTPDGLRSFRIEKRTKIGATVELDGSELSDSARQEEYAKALTKAVGLKSFDQFVFLQHFVFTFDESRHLLFWNSKELEAALFIAFGGDPEEQAAADHSRREMERCASLGRNAKWQSLQVRKRIDTIQASLGPKQTEDIAQLEASYRALEVNANRALGAAEQTDAKAADHDLALANATAELLALRNEYAKAFAQRVGNRRATTQHPLILEATSESRCGVCGTTGPTVSSEIQRRIATNVCPFCESPLPIDNTALGGVEELKRLDEQIGQARRKMESLSAARDRVNAERDDARKQSNAATAALRDFEAKHTDIARRAQGTAAIDAGGVAEELSRLATELRTLLQQSKEYYRTSNQHKLVLQRLQQQLEQQYKATEENFVPLFRNLAEHFIGLELDIASERLTSGFSLVLELRSSRRRIQYQLSESQRFFLDIALRMALTQFMSSREAPASFYIDTPEGSLDIAYEARAGEMFAEFVKGGNDLVMTANINTSQLLKKLAAKCGSSRMTLVRMTEWTDLSAVQMEEEALFREAYNDIEKELRGGGNG